MEENKTNLIINYLPQTLTDEEFRSMFLSIGAVKATKIVRDRATGYSYGFGFVDYQREEDAQRAIQTLNGLQLQNKRIKVAFSRSGENIKGANLYVRNLPPTMTQQDLENLFSQYGAIVQTRILTDQATGKSKGVGFVLYDTKEEAEEAMNGLNGHIPEGGSEPLNVKPAEDNKGKARPPVLVVQARGGAGAAADAGSYGGGAGFGGGYGNGSGGGGGGGGGRGGYAGASGGYGGAQGYGGGAMRNQGQGRYNRYSPMSANYSGNNTATNGNEGGFVLFVYNIGPTCDERALWQLFSPFGTIQKVNVIRDHGKDQGKGYGFVTMTNYHDGMAAIQSLNGYRYASKPLQVSFKTPKA